LSPKDGDEPRTFLGDADLSFFYLRGGRLEVQAAKINQGGGSGQHTAQDILGGLRRRDIRDKSGRVSRDVARSFVSDMRSIPHAALPMGAEVAEDALALYIKYGGRRKLSYFDSMHVATARRYALPFLTSDGFIIENSKALDVDAVNLSLWE
jgi:predicted nucleic acid-binding protein